MSPAIEQSLIHDCIQILDVDNVLTSFSLLLELISAVHLRFTQPELERPFKIPGGKWTFAAVAAVPFLIALTLVIVTIYEDWHSERTALYSIVVLTAIGLASPLITKLAKARGWWAYVDYDIQSNTVPTTHRTLITPRSTSGSVAERTLSGFSGDSQDVSAVSTLDPPAGGVLEALRLPLAEEPTTSDR